MIKRYSVLLFVLITVLLSFAAYFLPLPVDQKGLLVPVVLVFIPTVVCIPIALLAEGRAGIRQLFSSVRGAWKWVLIGTAVGAPAIPQTIVLIALSIFLTWAYVHSRGSLLTVTLLHGVQNGLVVLNRGLDIAEAAWLMMGVYGALAVLLIIFERRLFFTAPAKS